MLRHSLKLLHPLREAVSVSGKQFGVLGRAVVGTCPSEYGRVENVEDNDQLKKYIIDVTESTDHININVEELDKEMQEVFVERYYDTVKKDADKNEKKRLMFNNIHEEVFRTHLNMPLRRLGYDSWFERYNDDRGLAIFKPRSKKMTDVDSKRIGAFNRMAYTKTRKVDILNITM